MSSCCLHNRDTGRFFGWFARRYRRRFDKRGFEKSQTQLVYGITQNGIRDATLLEIGCGVGYLHQRLLQDGAQSAVGVDLSEPMLTQARGAAAENGLADRTQYLEGDFVNLADRVEPADIVVLDKVICCYPDAHSLVERSTGKAQRIYAFTIPRPRWFIRLMMECGTALLQMIRCGFRGYVHDPEMIDTWLLASGFERAYENHTFVWLTRVYRRRATN